MEAQFVTRWWGGAVQVWPPAWALTLAQASLASGSLCKGLKQIPSVKTP